MKFKIGDKVKVNNDNDNENYDSFKDKVLIITHAENEGRGYDTELYPQGLYSFKTEMGEDIQYSLYDYELERISRGEKMKCKDKVKEAFESRMEDIRILWKAENNETEDLGKLDEYGLCFDYVDAGTFENQKRPYKRWQLSWGGPSEEFRMYEDGTIEFWYLDWFDGACVDVEGDDHNLIKHLWGIYNE